MIVHESLRVYESWRELVRVGESTRVDARDLMKVDESRCEMIRVGPRVLEESNPVMKPIRDDYLPSGSESNPRREQKPRGRNTRGGKRP